LPAGAGYEDNFDGTRTLSWLPLQPDVGITEFTIVAVDSTEPLYRVSRTVRIRVNLPDDLSTIPRVGDPVVLPLKGTDPNGTIPDLAVLNPPAGSTFVPHRTEPGMRLLRFVPEEAGVIMLEVEARDADDPSLVARTSVMLDVRDPDDYILPGERLRQLAQQHDTTQLPGWIQRSDVASREGHMREYIDRVMRRYAGDIALWDVVNESFEDDGRLRNSVWYQAMGERYIDIAFRQARQSDPLATLIYNDYDVAWFGPKADAMFTMLQGLRDRGVPIDGVGFQMHVYAAFDAFEELRANIRRAESMGLDVYITEFEAACRAVQTWGFTDQYSWRRDFTPLILDTSYQPKPAYFALQSVLEGN